LSFVDHVFDQIEEERVLMKTWQVSGVAEIWLQILYTKQESGLEERMIQLTESEEGRGAKIWERAVQICERRKRR
jgi:hypothetical protein